MVLQQSPAFHPLVWSREPGDSQSADRFCDVEDVGWRDPSFWLEVLEGHVFRKRSDKGRVLLVDITDTIIDFFVKYLDFCWKCNVEDFK